MSPITTHVLDTSRGRPADGVPVILEFQSANGWQSIAQGVTNEDGRIPDLVADTTEIAEGVYRLRFDTQTYFAAQNIKSFYPTVTVTFQIADSRQHYHVPLLLSPFGYSTYRGT